MSELSKPLPQPPNDHGLWALIAAIAGFIALAAAAWIYPATKEWKKAETALGKWQPTVGTIDFVERRFKKQFYVILHGNYKYDGRFHSFQTPEFVEGEIYRASGIDLKNSQEVIVHVNPAAPNQSVALAAAQTEIHRIEAGRACYLAMSCGICCLLGILMHRFEKRKTAVPSQI